MAFRFISIWLISLLAGVSVATGDDRYVDNIAGNDQSSGLAESQPMKSIQAALSRSRPGDRIILKKSDEPYREQISLTGRNHSGLPGHPFEIVGNGAILQGAQPISGSAWESIGGDLFQFRPVRLSHQLLFRDGKPLEKVLCPPGGMPVLQPLQWTQRDGWIILRTEPGQSPYQYRLSCCLRPVGISLYRVHNVLISDLVIEGFQIDGINANDLVDDATILSCTLRGNGRSGLSVGGTSQVDLVSSLIGDNGESQVRSESVSRLAIDNCDILEQAGRKLIDYQGGSITRDGKLIQQ